MKINLPIAPLDKMAATAKNQSLTGHDGEFAEEFDAALARQKAENVPNAEARGKRTPHQPHQSHRHGRDGGNTPALSRHIERPPHSGAKPLHRLREMVPSTVTSRADDASDETSLQTDAPAIQSGPVPEPVQEPPQPISDENRISAITEQLLTEQLFGAPTSSVSNSDSSSEKPASDPIPRVDILPISLPREPDADVTPASTAIAPLPLFAAPAPRQPARAEPAKELRLTTKGEAIPNSAEYAAPVDTEVGEKIANVPITVREQQTHFSREPISRLPVTTNSTGAHDPVPPMGPEVGRSEKSVTQPKAVATSSEQGQLSLTQAKGTVERPVDDATNEPAPSVQILGKLLDVVHEEKAAARAPAASSATWLPVERPFGSLIRQIRLELSPASLGVVHITLKGVNASLSISIEAERAQTATSLKADRSVLSSSLTEAGYAIDDLVVTTLDRPVDMAPSSRSDQTAGSSSSQLSTGSNGSEHRQPDDGWRRSRPERERPPQSDTQETTQPNPTSSADPQRTQPASWRGRHIVRSI